MPPPLVVQPQRSHRLLCLVPMAINDLNVLQLLVTVKHRRREPRARTELWAGASDETGAPEHHRTVPLVAISAPSHSAPLGLCYDA